jgi:hypothetical protein
MKQVALKAVKVVALIALAVTTVAAKDGENSGRGRSDDDRPKQPKLLEWDLMVGVPRPYTGAANAIRGVAGGGLPWVIGSGRGELTKTGHLEIHINGLVFDPSDAEVLNRGLANQNTVPSFRAIVSCLSKDASGAATTINTATDLFPATIGSVSSGGGNAKIEANVQLPQPCIAPIVFVTSPGNAWFASTGF